MDFRFNTFIKNLQAKVPHKFPSKKGYIDDLRTEQIIVFVTDRSVRIKKTMVPEIFSTVVIRFFNKKETRN